MLAVKTTASLLILSGLCAVSVPAADEARAEATQRRIFFGYQTTVTEIPKSAHEIRVWIPLPRSSPEQSIHGIRLDTPGEWEVVDEDEFGNRFAAVTAPAEAGELRIQLTFEVLRKLRKADASITIAPDEKRKFLAPSRLVTLDGAVGKEAKTIAGNETDPYAIAKRLYDHIVDTVVYDKSGQGWGRGDSQFACDVRTGNCTDFHSLFIAEARSLGIPARFIMGFPIPIEPDTGAIGGYHCWAEFYIDGKGWIPLDASEAFKNPDRREFLFGALDPNRVQFTKGRDIRLPGAQSDPLNYSIYPHVEIDGKRHTQVAHKFSYRNLEQ